MLWLRDIDQSNRTAVPLLSIGLICEVPRSVSDTSDSMQYRTEPSIYISTVKKENEKLYKMIRLFCSADNNKDLAIRLFFSL
jgi:hypothetical protein